ncbi:MAG: hypothetical protein ABIB93_02525, partial [Chloroflexota bacterium]
YFDTDGDGDLERVLGSADWGAAGTFYLKQLEDKWIGLGMIPACRIRTGRISLHLSRWVEEHWGRHYFSDDLPFSNWPSNALQLDKTVFNLEFALSQEPIPAYLTLCNPLVNPLDDTGEGKSPMIKCVWETPDDADPAHTRAGVQVNPSGQYQVDKIVWFWAIVADPQGTGSVERVSVDTFYPEGAPMSGYPLYHTELVLADFAAGIEAFQQAYEQGLVEFAAPYTFSEVTSALEQGQARAFCGHEALRYNHPAGDYLIRVRACDTGGNQGIPWEDYLTYVPVTACEFDFTGVSYGSIDLGTSKWVEGDLIFGTEMSPTVRNIGNTNALITVRQDDMGFGQSVTPDGPVWNLVYNARLGIDGAHIAFSPSEEVTLSGVLLPGSTERMDFSIYLKHAMNGKYHGGMNLGFTFAPFGP